MTIKRYAEIAALVDQYDALPDGAFVQALADQGVDTEELGIFMELQTQMGAKNSK